MKKRPIAVTIIAVLLILAGIGGLAGNAMHFKSLAADHYASVWIAAVDLLAIVAGGFVFRGRNWARWLAVAWIAFHVVISIWNPWQQLLMHGLIFALFVWVLFRRDSRAFFCTPQVSA